jgi:pimeloyl-ACP methyl ester carboxylesterase
MTELLNTNAVSEAAEGYRQLYALHRLRRILSIWGSAFSAYADIPYTDFHILASSEDFRAAVAKLVVPTMIIRGSVHLYIAEITGRNIFLEEMKQFSGGAIPDWDPDNPIIPSE